MIYVKSKIITHSDYVKKLPCGTELMGEELRKDDCVYCIYLTSPWRSCTGVN